MEGEPFTEVGDLREVNVSAFLRISMGAVEKFLERIDSIVPGSHQDSIIKRRAGADSWQSYSFNASVVSGISGPPPSVGDSAGTQQV